MNSRLSTEQQLSSSIKAEALSLGFFACGIARATPVDAETASAFRSWIGNGCHAGMEYMARHTDIRLNPDLLLPGAKSVVCVAMAYAPQRTMPADEYQIAAYAYGKDYHDAVKARLRALAAHMEQAAAMAEPQPGGATGGGVAVTRVCCDTAPVLERYWAMQAGLGWTGRNHQLIIPGAGSMFFLGEVFTTLALQPDAPIAGHCGSCHACTKACPTHALRPDGTLDARRCLSYQTIENRGPIPPGIASAMGNSIYGCDRCQAACPHNARAPKATAAELQPDDELMAMRKADWHALTPDRYRRLFKGSAVKRCKYEGLMRNIKAAAGGNDASGQGESKAHGANEQGPTGT